MFRDDKTSRDQDKNRRSCPLPHHGCLLLLAAPVIRTGSSSGPLQAKDKTAQQELDGLLKLADLEVALTDDTAVMSLMWANNETGALFPVEQIAQICQSRGVLCRCDTVQTPGYSERASANSAIGRAWTARSTSDSIRSPETGVSKITGTSSGTRAATSRKARIEP